MRGLLTLAQCDSELKAFVQKYGRRPTSNEPGFRAIARVLQSHYGSTIRRRCDNLKLAERYVPWKDIAPYLKKLSAIEVVILRRAILLHEEQRVIGHGLGMTQAGVCYRIQESIARVKAWAKHPKLSRKETVADLRGVGLAPLTVRILWEMYRTPSQSVVATRLKITQGKVRYRLVRAVEVLRAAKYDPYLAIFDDIRTGVIKASARPSVS